MYHTFYNGLLLNLDMMIKLNFNNQSFQCFYIFHYHIFFIISYYLLYFFLIINLFKNCFLNYYKNLTNNQFNKSLHHFLTLEFLYS